MRPLPGIPEVARMLLSSDGSTTILLEALLHCRLSVHVTNQDTVSANDVAPNAVAALGLAPDATVVERRSSLVTVDGTVVSINIVVFANQPGGWSGSPTDPVPLGKKLRDRQTKQHREILSAGTTEWPGDGNRRTCVYKEYVITCDDNSRLYILEKFSPDHVPPPRMS
ncbi:MAG: hypothetical protein QOJ54_855 [Aliidongia sp.]|nr:hypothetical protein [Aliidongia sp.]